MKNFMKISPVLVVISTASVLLSTASSAHAQIAPAGWVASHMRLTPDGPPNVVTGTDGGGANAILFVDTTPPPQSIPAALGNKSYAEAKNVPTGSPYKTYSGQAYVKSQVTFTWTGSGSPPSFTSTDTKTWATTGTGATTFVRASFDGTAKTTASGTTTHTNNITTSGQSFSFATGAYAISGYSGGGYINRTASAEWKYSL